MIEIEEKEEFVQTVEKPLSLSKRGLGRSPKAGRRDASPRIHPPFRGKGGRGIGIINQKLISKTDFFYKLEFVIIFYKKDDGTEPAKEFLDGLDNKMRAKMIRTVELLRDYGYELREPYSKHLNDGIFELRAKVSTDITRVLYFFVSGRKAILTHGFVKKTQKTPQSEIEKAENYRRDYLSKNKS